MGDSSRSPVTLSIAVMAHPKRSDAAERLARQVDADDVVWDTNDDEWDTGRRALAVYDRTKMHHIVLQDDALPIDGFRDHAIAALKQHPDTLVSFYLGTSRPPQWQPAVDDACMRAEDAGAAWIEAPELLHGVAIAIPTSQISDLLSWCTLFETPYDQRIGSYWRRHLLRPILYTWPSLVDHDDAGTLVDHSDRAARDQPRRARLVGTPSTWATPSIALESHLP